MSTQTDGQGSSSYVDELRAELDKLGEAEDASLDAGVDEDNSGAGGEQNGTTEGSATPSAADDGKTNDAGLVDGAAKADKGKEHLVPYAALKEERTQKHLYKAQTAELQGTIAELKAQVEALKAGKQPDESTEDLDTELLESLKGEGPEFERLAKQVEKLREQKQELEQRAPATATAPSVNDRAVQASDAEEAVESIPWLKGIIAKGGPLAQQAFDIDKSLTGSYESLAERYRAVVKELAKQNDLPEEVVLRGATDIPKADATAGKTATVEDLETEINTLSDLSAGSTRESDAARYNAMNPHQRIDYISKMKPGDQEAFVERMAALGD